MTIEEIKELYKMIADRDDQIGDLISEIADKDAQIIKLENVEVTNARLVEDIKVHKALITDLEGELTEIHEQYKRVMEERCAPDEHHCTCVPLLRKRIAELEADRDAETENCRLTQDRLQRLTESNLALKNRITELEALVGKIKRALDIDSYTDFFNHVKMIIELWEAKNDTDCRQGRTDCRTGEV
jgi:DNA repair exonuclease SbcCD ATPase subunit